MCVVCVGLCYYYLEAKQRSNKLRDGRLSRYGTDFCHFASRSLSAMNIVPIIQRRKAALTALNSGGNCFCLFCGGCKFRCLLLAGVLVCAYIYARGGEILLNFKGLGTRTHISLYHINTRALQCLKWELPRRCLSQICMRLWFGL